MIFISATGGTRGLFSNQIQTIFLLLNSVFGAFSPLKSALFRLADFGIVFAQISACFRLGLINKSVILSPLFSGVLVGCVINNSVNLSGFFLWCFSARYFDFLPRFRGK